MPATSESEPSAYQVSNMPQTCDHDAEVLKSRKSRTRAFAAVAALFAAVVASSMPAAAPSLSHLRGVDELKSWFNASKGHPRLILLLSPT